MGSADGTVPSERRDFPAHLPPRSLAEHPDSPGPRTAAVAFGARPGGRSNPKTALRDVGGFECGDGKVISGLVWLPRVVFPGCGRSRFGGTIPQHYGSCNSKYLSRPHVNLLIRYGTRNLHKISTSGPNLP